jgi:cell division protein FtsL
VSARAGAARRAPARRPRQRQRERPRAVPSPRRAPARSARPRPALLLIPLVALLLGGIVWVNVARLNLATQTSAVIEQSREVQFENVRLQAQLDQRNVAVENRARRDLQMAPAQSEAVTYIDLPKAAAGR